MKPNLPQEPNPNLIESMCMRYDHSHGIRSPRFNNNTFEIETEEEFEQRQDSNRRMMRKLYEEVSGYGFYQYTKDDSTDE
ncbi:hypothetical protein [Yersinia phage fHe-Yen9-04]|uniref:Uncharacterized protein n=2 Tax=Eneladusvirus Yen904 TaxID=2560849 RepID=A0A2C9CXC5_9CAUD|nr:hypothetical protein FDJ41_gp516 [Yersinia phage fHe-Yen9-04]SOK58664.1 hypothetical protein [Yersinia phage fHe-Yen9-04]SOK59199.1 hypothetical protein [Yersinia phage fHe-Yen9-03]VUE36433.1 hypothetical protein [Yersinia phage fHe-Yen9-04]